MPRNPQSVSPSLLVSAMPRSWTPHITSLQSCSHPASPMCSHSQWVTTRATVVSGTLRCHPLRAIVSTSRLRAEPMG